MVEQSLDPDYLSRWIGRGETLEDTLEAGRARLLAATLNLPGDDLSDGNTLPPFWHWIYFHKPDMTSDLFADGLPAPDEFLPPVDLPRRMFAGARLEPGKGMKLGEKVHRVSKVKDISVKKGRSGTLCFTVVRHEFMVGDEVRCSEEHDIVYREEADPSAPVPEPPKAPAYADWVRTIDVDPVTLFRYSALTFNAHRIHYDRTYCLEQEGYAGLVVHGPLIATWLLDLLRTRLPNYHIKEFAFRGISPLFDTEPLTVSAAQNGDKVELWAANHKGDLATKATAVIG